MRPPEERPAPLLLALHGNHPDGTGQQLPEWTAFDKQTDFAIAYPDGTGIGGTRVTTHIIDGGGHTWPDGTAEEVCRFAGPLPGNAETRRIS
jgi:poly(3-hydroxybutyrate) depolymerase